MASILQTALELGLISSLTVLALFLSYSMLNVCDLSTDGCFTLGAVVGAVVALSGHPYLSLPAAMLAGVLSGFTTAILQTKMGIDSLLSGIIVNTGLYSINIGIMGGASLLNMNKTETVFTKLKALLKETAFSGMYKTVVAAIAVVLVILFLSWFLRTRLGLAIRATGNNPDMVRSSSINPAFTTIVGLCISNSDSRRRQGFCRKRRYSPQSLRGGDRCHYFPACLCRGAAIPYAGLHAEACLFRDCHYRDCRAVSQITLSGISQTNDPQSREGGSVTCWN